MTDYTELVNALRCKGLSKGCDSCDYGFHISPDSVCNDACRVEQIIDDAAYAIESLQKELDAADAIEELRKVNCELREMYEDAVRKLPNRGEWIVVSPMVDSVQCSICGGQLFSAELETPYCPYCGAKMNDSNASNALNALNNAHDGPIITPCRGCSDYDGYGGCKSKCGCASAKMEVQK